MIGVSLVMFDGFFLKFFAAGQLGGVTLINQRQEPVQRALQRDWSGSGRGLAALLASMYQQHRAYDFPPRWALGFAVFAVG